jgi:phosphatidylethanolamine-binding protein (PEBP) family uncharacterized protein
VRTRVRNAPLLLFASVLAGTLALSGCGGSGSKSSTSQAQATTTSQQVTAATSQQTTSTDTTSQSAFALSSPAVQTDGESNLIQARYTCDGADVSPPLHWGIAPAGTAEIAIAVVHIGHKAFDLDWAIVGLKPTLRRLPAGAIPPGAIPGRNSAGHLGYQVCPPKGTTARYVMVAYALAHKIPTSPGFDSKAVITRASGESLRNGLLDFSYRRRG